MSVVETQQPGRRQKMGLAGLRIVLVVAGVSNVGAIARVMKDFEIYPRYII
ncbi:hypothetical protein [Nostoc sp. DedQUE12b]|uniref:hypothetical protein n=1 Tax=Nostoc sp. DedQUE12b TaxID=3075398 RepID=UPI002AD4D382|nr:hypothetical protein [Nostoc sp. DedQUE12b]